MKYVILVVAAVLALASLSVPALAGPPALPDPEAAPGFELAPQHDPNCADVYNATTAAPVLWYYPAGGAVYDDLHTTLTGDAALCAFTLRGRNLMGTAGPRSVFVSFHAGDVADGLPGALTAGPFEVSFAAVTGDQTVHFEAPNGYLTPNAWIRFSWPTSDVALRGITGATVGGTHDVVYDPVQAIFDDYGTGSFAGYYAVVFSSPPVPTHPVTWGSVKATYR